VHVVLAADALVVASAADSSMVKATAFGKRFVLQRF
jgi:hypothetical protein